MFCDTPGLHQPQDQTGSNLNKQALQMIREADVIVLLAPLDEYIGTVDHVLIKKLVDCRQPLIIALTKADLVNDEAIKAKIEA